MEHNDSSQPAAAFDGQIVCVAGSDLNDLQSVDSFFAYPYGSETVIPIDNELLILAAKRQRAKYALEVMRQMGGKSSAAVINRVIEPCLKRTDKLLQRNVGKPAVSREIIEIISDGRLKLVWLLNSMGGFCSVADEFTAVAESIKARCGKVVAYVTTTAQSAAAEIFATADERYVLRDSELMWHPSFIFIIQSWHLFFKRIFCNEVSPSDLRTFVKKIRAGEFKKGKAPLNVQDQDMEFVRDFFKKNAAPERKEELLRKLDESQQDPSNPEKEFRLSGNQLVEYGLAAQAYDDVGALFSDFMSQARLFSMPPPDISALNIFVGATQIEEQMRNRHNVRLKLHVDRATETTYPHILDGGGNINEAMEYLEKILRE